MSNSCEDCIPVQKLAFQMEGLDISLQKNKVCIEGIKTQQEARDVEHEAMIQNLSTRMDSMEQKFDELKKEVKSDIASIKEDIPNLFENAINKLMARVLRYIVLGFASLLAFLILIVTLAFARPYVVASLQELVQKAQHMEITK